MTIVITVLAIYFIGVIVSSIVGATFSKDGDENVAFAILWPYFLTAKINASCVRGFRKLNKRL